MHDPILHHHLHSPFAEKIRLLLGHKQLAWHSVIVPLVMPKPELVALTGGYRRAPVLQIGADVYCDTALIADVLEHLQPQPTIYPEPEKGMARVLAQWADQLLVPAVLACALQPAGVAELFAGAPPSAAEAFVADRARMRGNGVPPLAPADAAAACKSYLRRISDMLDDRPFLLGDLPCVCDFAVYAPLWFLTRVHAVRGMLDLTPAVLDWMDRMKAIGHGRFSKLSAEEALTRARESMPHTLLTDSTFQDEHGIALGRAVTVRAESFGTERTAGTLVACTRTHYTLARRIDAPSEASIGKDVGQDVGLIGTVHVHFPRIGYVLEAA